MIVVSSLSFRGCGCADACGGRTCVHPTQGQVCGGTLCDCAPSYAVYGDMGRKDVRRAAAAGLMKRGCRRIRLFMSVFDDGRCRAWYTAEDGSRQSARAELRIRSGTVCMEYRQKDGRVWCETLQDLLSAPCPGSERACFRV